MRNSWTNFRAHYNTYYNAEKSFNAGLKKVEDQPVEINPELPIRVHRKPPPVSEEEFDNTIEKGAQILRKFSESKWTDDALFLIGKSYYYKGDYYLAIEKFEELKELSAGDRFKQRAAIWKGRSLLDLEQYGNGVSYIKSDLNAEFWSASQKAEFKVLLAEHLAMQENWEEAAGYLSEALANLEENELKARTFFLYGQVLERLERYGEAFFAFDNVASRFPDYEYVYWSNLKKAEVARKEGNLEPALAIFTSMSKDDKNFSRLDRINYEIARTLEMQENIQPAEQAYKEILRSDYSATSRNVQAKTYYRLGKIYSEKYNDFRTAAAYFDSSSSQATNIKYLGSNFNAQKLAGAYGRYARLKNEINRLDSLLWLGSLQPAQLDSVLNIVREQKRRAIKRGFEDRGDSGNRLVNINSGNGLRQQDTNSTAYGFLNYRNPQLKRQSVNKFRAVWGNRPLMDNWRRSEAVRVAGISTNETETTPAEDTVAPVSNENDSELNIDISEIPSTPKEKNGYIKELTTAKYELGNLLLLTLDMPDSAKTYFNSIVRNYPDSPLVPQSMYSLFEIHSETGNEKRAEYWADRIMREFSGSRYANKLSARINGADDETEADSSTALLSQFRYIEASADSLSPVQAERFRSLAIANRSAEIAPFIYYKAIKTYVELAKDKTKPELYNRFLQARAKPDSLPGAADSLAGTLYPFYGTYWDSVRTTITEYDTMFAQRPHKKELATLKKVLDSSAAPPESEVISSKQVPSPSPAQAPENSIKACTELDPDINIVGGMSNFVSTVDLSENMRNVNLAGEIAYKILITKEGTVGSYSLISTDAVPAVEQAFGTAIENNLLFDPVFVEGEPRGVSCKMTFPLTPPSSKPAPEKSIRACKDMDADIGIVGGMSNFLARVNYPEDLRDMKLSGEITYEIWINKEGDVGSYRLVSPTTLPGVEQAFDDAIENSLLFDPVSVEGEPRGVSCKMTFPLTPPPPKPSPKERIKSCTDFDDINIVGGMSNFLARVNYPEDLRDRKFSGELTYEIWVTKEGHVGSSRLVSTKTLPAVEKAFDDAIKNSLLFDPIPIEDERQGVRCRITFPVKN